MALSKEYSSEQLNFFRLCHVTTDLIPEGLHTVFKREWDTRYGSTHGYWQDTAKNGMDFFSTTTPAEKKKKELSIIKKGNTQEWDCTCLFYSILYSSCIGRNGLNPTVEKNVDSLRVFRNTAFGHVREGKITEAEFKTSIQNVINAFKDLKLDPSPLEMIRDQTSFPTDELNDIQQKWEAEKQKNAEPSCFCVLPPKPSHDTFQRNTEVSKICQKVDHLTISNPKEVTVTYLSGSPGSGKSTLARQVGKHLYGDVDKDVSANFVMTLDGSSLLALTQSYTDFARQLCCDENAIMTILSSKELNQEERLLHLQSLAALKIGKFSTWLIIVDNVEDLSVVSKFIPQAGQPVASDKGHILITTQNIRSILPSSHSYHLSLSRGMEPNDAVKMLVSISKMDENEDTVGVATELDFQPLALACAAIFIKCASRTDPTMNWAKCLANIQNEQEMTEKNYKETSHTYSKTMTTAVKIAVDKAMENNPALVHALEFLSVMAPEYMPLKNVIDYVQKCMPNDNVHDITTDILNSSLILSTEEEGVVTFIRIHQVVYKIVQMSNEQKSKPDFWFKIVDVFSYLEELDRNNTGYITLTKPLVAHFIHITNELQRVKIRVSKDRLKKKNNESISESQLKKMENILSDSIAKVCSIHGQYEYSKILLQMTLNITENIYGKNSTHVARRLNALGIVLKDLGDLKQAKEHLERALAINECNYDKNHPSVATSLSNLGIVVKDLGDLKQAKEHLERALAINECNYDKNHPSVATSLSNLGMVLKDLGDLKQAKEHLERALSINEQCFGKNQQMWISLTRVLKTMES